MTALSILGVFLTTLQAPTQVDDSKLWGDYLRRFAASTGCSLLAEMRPGLRFPANLVLPSKPKLKDLESLASILRGELREVDGLYIIQNSAALASDREAEVTQGLFELFGSSADQRWINGSYKLAELSPDQRNALSSIFHRYKDAAARFQSHRDTTSFSARFVPVIYYRDAQGTTKKLFPPNQYPSKEPLLVETSASQSEIAKNQKTGLLFAEPSIIDLKSLIEKAGSHFTEIYEFDSKFANSSWFVCGTFSKDQFETAMSSLLMARPFKKVDQKKSREDLMKELFSGPWKDATIGSLDFSQSGVSEEDFVRGSKISASDLAKRDRRWAEWLESKGVPSNAELTLGSGINLVFSTGANPDSRSVLTGSLSIVITGR